MEENIPFIENTYFFLGLSVQEGFNMDSFLPLMHLLPASTFCNSYRCDIMEFLLASALGREDFGFFNFK